MQEEFENLILILAIIIVAWLIRINFVVVPCQAIEMRQAENVLISLPVECK